MCSRPDKALMEIAPLPCLSFGWCLGRAGCIIFSGRRPHVDLPNLRLVALHCTNRNQECSSATALHLNHMEGFFSLENSIFRSWPFAHFNAVSKHFKFKFPDREFAETLPKLNF